MSGYPQYPQTAGYGLRPKPKLNGLAIASLVLGLVSLLLSCLTGLVGLILGFFAIVQIQGSSGRQTGLGMAITGIILSIVFSLVMPILLFIPALAAGLSEATSEAASVASEFDTQDKMRTIALAMHNYHDEKRKLPTDHYISGKPALSWRVMLLPHLEGGKEVYDQFDLGQSWDSIQNVNAARNMPDVFRRAGIGSDETTFKRPIGNGALFDGTENEKVRLESISDGTSRTIMCVDVESAQACLWSKPDDFRYDPADPTQGLQLNRRSQFTVVFADASVHKISSTADSEIKGRFTKAGND
jgi:hypothetical protein